MTKKKFFFKYFKTFFLQFLKKYININFKKIFFFKKNENYIIKIFFLQKWKFNLLKKNY